jgi:AcrR family transcriptional regulator
MQIKKDDIYESILKTARKEFLKKGYKDTNMRYIADKTGVGLSNIYNYFHNKDEIFREVLAPVLTAFDETMAKHNCEANINIDIFSSQEYLKKQTEMFVDLIYEHKDELKILLFKSYGSSLEDFREEFINEHTKIGMKYLQLMKEKYPHLNIDLSDFFIHTQSSWWMSVIGELVTHDLKKKELIRFVLEYIEFVTAGWKGIMKA